MSQNLRREVSKLVPQEMAELLAQTDRDVAGTVNRALGAGDGAPGFDSARLQARLGELGSWDVAAEDGSIQRYGTMCTLMRKDLA
ncbi:hypothetical protein [Kitasatospora azatica]|uniref:hypothetical protein n=1 Tax=Kitasatospora azatica TaxID=58347 RepID=UPI0005647590|nr:hypothetical protein [Kitasatospora azatica]